MSALKRQIRLLTSNHFWLRCCALSSYNVVSRLLAMIRRRTDTGHDSMSEQERERYEQQMFDSYKRFLSIDRFYGKAAEVGPGHLIGVGERLLQDGCSSVDLVDRFVYDHPANPVISFHYGVSVEKFFNSNKGYDFILSTAVLEHVPDPVSAIRVMASAMNPGGTMAHAVDCRDHGQFSDHLHDLSFLRVPPLLYVPMAAAGGPNRVRMSAYISECSACGLETTALVTSLAGIPQGTIPEPLEYSAIDPRVIEDSRQYVARIYPKLNARFRNLSDMDLMVAGFILIARKPLLIANGGAATRHELPAMPV